MLTILKSTTLGGCNAELFNILNKNRSDKTNHIIFTPDRMNFLIEQQLFNFISNKSVFDINVTTLSRFSLEYVNKFKISGKLLTKWQAIAIIKKVLIENVNKLKFFKNSINYNGFALKVYELLSLFKSNNVNIKEVKKTEYKNLNNKLQDLKIIFNAYEEYLKNDYTDSFNKLNLFSTLINKHDFKDTYVYFVGFDDFTKQTYDIIKNFCKCAKGVFVATASNKDFKINNDNLYTNLVFYNLISICKTFGIDYKVVGCETAVSEFKNLQNNIFGYNIKKINKTEKVKIIKCNGLKEEIEFIVKDILYNIKTKGRQFKDYYILTVSNNFSAIKSAFNKHQIPLFTDESMLLKEHSIVRFLTDLYSAIESGLKTDNSLKLIKNTYLNIEEEELVKFESFVNKNTVWDYGALKCAELSESTNIFKILNILKNSKILKQKTVKDFIKETLQVLNKLNFEENCNLYINSLIDINTIRLSVQAYQKMQNVFKELTELMGGCLCSFKEYFNIIKVCFENINLNIPPIVNQCVFLGDVVNSFIPNVKNLYILGAVSGVIPAVSPDSAILNTNEINSFKGEFALHPNVEFLNKKNKMRVFENISKATESLVITYPKSVGDNQTMPSTFVTDAVKLFGENILFDAEAVLDFKITPIYNTEMFLLNNCDKQFLENNLITGLKNYEFYSDSADFKKNLNDIYSALNLLDGRANVIEDNIKHEFKLKNIENAKELYFKNKMVSVSQIESYYCCPLNFYFKYGLKLKEEDSEIDAKIIGTILHLFLSELLKSFKNFNDESEIEIKAKQLINKICKGKDYCYLINNKKNNYLFYSLQHEAVRIAKRLSYELSKTEFKPARFEYQFLDEEIVLKDYNLQLKGFIDRIDENGNDFRIIDYKTGKADFNNFNSLVNGTKLQIFVYAVAYKKKHKGNISGMFYLPINNSFEKSSKETFKYAGVINNKNLLAFDSNLKKINYTSTIINAKTDSKGNVSSGKFALNEDEINYVCDFAVEKVNHAIGEILKGNISPKPVEIGTNLTHCQYCSFKSSCVFCLNKTQPVNAVNGINTFADLCELGGKNE